MATPTAARFLAGEEALLALAGDEAKAFREALRAEPNLLIIFGSELRGRDIDALVNFGIGAAQRQFACLGDYANSRGAADMGLLPDLLPGYVPVEHWRHLARGVWRALACSTPGMDLGGNVRCR